MVTTLQDKKWGVIVCKIRGSRPLKD